MPPDSGPIAVLRGRLAAALARWRPPAELRDAPAERLKFYAHELAFAERALDGRASDPSDADADGVDAEGWIAEAPDPRAGVRARRCYLVAEVPVGAGAPWFPGLLATAARWRSHLGPDEQADLTMLLVAEPPSPGAQEVDGRAAGRVSVLERNEALAQVLVWTPGTDRRKWPTEADQFVARLRLGPMRGPPGAPGGDLSPVDAVFEGTGLRAELRERWREVLMAQGIKEVERARRLLAVADEPSGAAAPHGGADDA